MGKRNASELLHEERRTSSVLDRGVANKPSLHDESGRNIASKYMKRDHVGLSEEGAREASLPKAHGKSAQSGKVRLFHSSAASALVAAEAAIDAERDEEDGSPAKKSSPVERLRQSRSARREAKQQTETQALQDGPSPIEAAQQQNLVETQSYLDTQAVLESQSQAVGTAARASGKNIAARSSAAHAGRALRAGFATGGASGKLAHKASYANQAKARAAGSTAGMPFKQGAATTGAPGASGSAGAVGGGSGLSIGGALAVIAVFMFATMFLIAVLAATEVQKKAYAAGDLSGLPGWVTAEFVEECLYIQEKYGLSAAVAIAQAHKEVGGCWDGSTFTYNGQPYDMVNVANNYFCCTTGGSPGNTWAEEDNYQTYDGTVFISPFSPGYEWRSYEDAKQSIYDRARILLHESVYAIVRDSAGKSTEEQAQAICNSAWCEGGYDSLMGYIEQYNLSRLDGMTVDEWRASGGGGGGEIVSLTGGELGNPLSGQDWTASSGFGYREFDDSFHKGFDMAAAEGTPYYAAEDGTVLYATNDGGYNGGAGNWVVIDHGNGIVTKYMHSSATFVSPGETVKRGQHIGNVGNTGESYGAHLHFQVEINGQAVDPLPLIGG